MTGVDVDDTRVYGKISGRDDMDIMEWDLGV